MNEKLTIQLPVDSDGFVEYKCPSCNRIFRLKTNEFSDENGETLMCAYCGISSNVSKYMPEYMIKYIQECEAQYIQSKLDDALKKVNHKYKFLTVKYKPGKRIEPTKINLNENDFSIIKCNRCNSDIKVDDIREIVHYCPYCEVIFYDK